MPKMKRILPWGVERMPPTNSVMRVAFWSRRKYLIWFWGFCNGRQLQSQIGSSKFVIIHYRTSSLTYNQTNVDSRAVLPTVFTNNELRIVYPRFMKCACGDPFGNAKQNLAGKISSSIILNRHLPFFSQSSPITVSACDLLYKMFGKIDSCQYPSEFHQRENKKIISGITMVYQHHRISAWFCLL